MVPLTETPDCSIRHRQERWLATWCPIGGTEAQLEVAPLKAVAAHTPEGKADDSLCSSPGGRDSSGVYLEEERRKPSNSVKQAKIEMVPDVPPDDGLGHPQLLGQGVHLDPLDHVVPHQDPQPGGPPLDVRHHPGHVAQVLRLQSVVWLGDISQ